MSAAEDRSSEIEALLDAAVDAVILIDHRGLIEVFNRSAERLFGYAALEVVGQNVKILMSDVDRRQHDGYMERYERSGVPHIIGIGREVLARRKDGSTFPAFLSVGRVAGVEPPRYVGFIQDLTLRTQALSAVVRERDRANRYLEAAQTILVALDPHGRVTLVNRKGCEILKTEESALLGTDWFDTAVPGPERERARADFALYLNRATHEPHHVLYPVQPREGAPRAIAWRYVAVQEGAAGVTGILCSGDDVTDALQAAEEAREARERMMHVSRLATMGEMATGISHELNQPLAAIATYAQAAKRLLTAPHGQSEDISEALEQIAAQALRAGEIIRRLRTLVSRRQSQREPTHLNTLIEELGTLTRADARLHDIRVTLDLAPDLPMIEVDPIQIQQVLLNLVRNAEQALEGALPGAREIVISTRLRSDGYVEAQVRDSGPGVAATILEDLFQPFATTKVEGTGLGLAISRSIIEAHKGKLEYAPESPRGASFVFRLPVPSREVQ
jgi:two-component system sensor kinase FixL